AAPSASRVRSASFMRRRGRNGGGAEMAAGPSAPAVEWTAPASCELRGRDPQRVWQVYRANSSARLTSWIAWVTWMPRGHESVQLKVVRHRHTPSASLRISRRSAAPSSRESKMNRCALTIAAGPKYDPSAQKTGQEVVQHAQRMHLVVSSKRSRSVCDWIRSAVGWLPDVMRYGSTSR